MLCTPRLSHASLSSEMEEISVAFPNDTHLHGYVANSWPKSQDLGIALVPLAYQHMPKLSMIG